MTKKRKTSLEKLFLLNFSSKTRFAEAYRTLRTNVHFSFMDKGFRVILVTSAGPGEGKTSTVANLAYTMAQAGKKVLMIDADMRKPRLHELAPLSNSVGLSGLLADICGTEVAQGATSEFATGDLIRLLGLQKKTGFLHLQNGDEEIEMLFLQGELADLNWLSRPPAKRLASVLVNSQLLTQQQSKAALARQKDTGQKLAFILLNMGFLDQDQLTGILNIHMLEGLRTALNFNAGEFSFKELSGVDFDRPSFDPINFKKLYRQLVIGGEELPYLQRAIGEAILNTADENLKLLPAGKLPPNPSELLGSDRMAFIINNLQKRFDVVLIDSPPILPASDALLLAPRADGVVFILKPGIMNRNLVKKVVDQIQLTKANLIGVVLNNVDTRKNGYYSYYHKYYAKYYGSD
jgi:capsular exopolysaccharide synthesis family protein